MFSSVTVSVSIACAPDTVYDFVRDAHNLPLWASGLCKSVRAENGSWIVQTPQGEASLRFVERNDFRVLDHVVTPAPGMEIHVPMRVVPNLAGSELLFTVFRLPEMTDAAYAADIQAVECDLVVLKTLLES
jgi:hypothetical protein